MKEFAVLEQGYWKVWSPCNYFSFNYPATHECGYWMPSYTYCFGWQVKGGV